LSDNLRGKEVVEFTVHKLAYVNKREIERALLLDKHLMYEC